MKKFVPAFILLIFSLNAGAQLITRFTWENSIATTAVWGTNALSISSYATVSEGGTNQSKGLNPGIGSHDINLVLDGSAFNVPALDISIDFRREESQASFFNRGDYFNLGMNGGSLAVNFRLTSGQSFVSISSGNIYSIPDDHRFHNYRFNYDNNTGTAKLWADAVLVYTYSGTAGTPLYWTAAGNVTIGKDMDATGRNIAVLDNLVIQKYANALLPMKLLSFSGGIQNKYVVINWNTTEEINVHSFILERSSDGSSFSALKNIDAANGYSNTNHYQFTDSSLPLGAVAYYRLKMINNDGSFSYADTKAVSTTATNRATVTVFPNPTADFVNIKMNNPVAGKYVYTVCSVTGQVMLTAAVQVGAGAQQIKIDLTSITLIGSVLVQLSNLQNKTKESFTIIKK